MYIKEKSGIILNLMQMTMRKFYQMQKWLSKEEACRYLNLSRSTFDTYIRNGWIPKGEKRLGFKELSWLESDLDIACEKIRKMLINDKIGD